MAEDADRQVARTQSEAKKEKWRQIAKGYRDLAEATEENLAKPSAQRRAQG